LTFACLTHLDIARASHFACIEFERKCVDWKKRMMPDPPRREDCLPSAGGRGLPLLAPQAQGVHCYAGEAERRSGAWRARPGGSLKQVGLG
jgi:hypothetical protein